MATEKILNTRIQLKYDTLTNWNASTFKLKAGELAIVTLGENKDGTTAGTVNQHPVLFKVGTGDHTFSELPFASALAADVYAWAKAETVVLSGKTIQFKNGSNVVHSITLNYITESEATTLINNALTAYSTTEQMNAAIKVETDRATGIESGLDTRLKALENGDASVSTQISNAINALDSNASQTAGADGLALGVTLVDGKVTSITGSIAANTYDAYGSASAAESAAKSHAETKASAAEAAAKGYADTQIEAAEGRAATDAQNKANAALAEAKTYAEGQASAAQSAAEGKVTALAEGAVAQNTAAIAAINNTESGILAQAKADAKTKADKALEDAKAYADDLKDSILGEGISETFDTLKEIQTWIEGDGVNATELTEAIAEEAKTRGEEDTKLQNQINALGITDGKVSKAATADVANSLSDSAKAEVKAVKVDNATNADVAAKASGLNDSGVAAVKAVKVDNAGHADSADDAAKLGGVVAANYALKTDAQGYANTAEQNANDYTDTREVEIKKYADQAETDAVNTAKGYTDTREAAIKTAYEAYADQAETDAINAAKNYADGLAGNYATAEQGGKADTALQSISAGTGLKVTEKANNSQTIEIDNSVVFVFDCGSATKNID